MKKTTRLLIAVLTVVMLLSPIAVIEAAGVRPMGFNGDILTSAPIPEKHEDVELMWNENYKADPDDWAGVPSDLATDGEYLYTVQQNHLLKIDRFTGDIVDAGDLAGAPAYATIPPLVDREAGVILVGLNEGIIQALDYETLDSLWVYSDELGGQMIMPIVISDNYVYGGFWNGESENANFVQLKLRDNPVAFSEPEWSHTHTGGFYWTRPLIIDGKVIVGSDDGKDPYRDNIGRSKLLMFDEAEGELIDAIETIYGDLRSGIVNTGDIIHFVSKPGFYYTVELNRDGDAIVGFDHDSLRDCELPGQSVATPTISPLNNETVYITFGNRDGHFVEGGHGIAAVDGPSMSIRKTIEIDYYPQGTPLMKYEQNRVVLYVLQNKTPGLLMAITDEPEAEEFTGVEVLLTPFESDAQYALSSPVADDYGNLFFRNDSGTIFGLSPKLLSLEVQTPPTKTVYKPGEKFDPAGMVIVGTFANGTTRAMNVAEFEIPDFELTEEDEFVVVKAVRSYHDELELVDEQPVQTGGHLSDPITVEIPIEVKENEAPALNGWVKLSNGQVRYYIDGEYVTGLRKIGKTTYLFNKDGYRQTGWHVVGGKHMYFNTKNGGRWTGLRKIGKTTYLLASNGGKLYGWHRLGGKEFYFDPKHGGGMITGKRVIGKTTYLLSRSKGKLTGWHVLGGNKYYFDPNYGGGMVTGLRKAGGSAYYFFRTEADPGKNNKGAVVINQTVNWNGHTYKCGKTGIAVKIK